MIHVTIHHSSPCTLPVYYDRKGNEYSELEYVIMMRRKYLIKDIIKRSIITIILMVAMFFRAYGFLKTGV